MLKQVASPLPLSVLVLHLWFRPLLVRYVFICRLGCRAVWIPDIPVSTAEERGGL